MPTLYNNVISASGSDEDLSKFKSLIVENSTAKKTGDKCTVSYQIIKPIPLAVKGIQKNISPYLPFADDNFSFTIEKPNYKRIGLVDPKEFVKRAISRALISPAQKAPYTSLLEKDAHFAQSKPIEQCLEDSISSASSYEDITETALKVLKVLSKDCSKYAKKTYGTDEAYAWSIENYGNRWDGGTNCVIDADEDGLFQVSYQSALHPPKKWILSLIEKSEKLGLALDVKFYGESEDGNTYSMQSLSEPCV